VILVGDTPRDIACARDNGCRVLSVATGRYSLETLRSEQPDRAVRDLMDVGPLEELIEEVLQSG
jgi:phosphoglycolate phosphatase-like HAD superfamily hydrolase